MKLFAAIATSAVVGMLTGYVGVALASRNTSGTYSLPSGNPVSSGQTISSTWANNTLSDLSTEITDSLSRSGKGGMTAQLKAIDGTQAAPSYSFTSDPDTGLYRVTTNTLGFSAGGTLRESLSSTAITPTIPYRQANGSVSAPSYSFSAETGTGIYRAGSADLRLSIAGTDTILWSGTGLGVGDAPLFALDVRQPAGGSQDSLVRAKAGTHPAVSLVSGASSSGISMNVTSNGTNWVYDTTNPGMDIMFDTGGTLAFQTAPSGTAGTNATVTTRVGISSSGLKVGATGTAISASYGASYTIDFPNIATSGTCSLSSQTLTGVSTGGVCFVSPDADLGGGSHFAAIPDCYVSGADTVVVRLCNLTGGAWDQGSGSFRVRVFQP